MTNQKLSRRTGTPGPNPAEIRAARIASGLTQTAAADLIYSSLRTWQDWEAGKARMHPAFWELWKSKAR